MKKKFLLSGIAWIFAALSLIIASLWLLREIGWVNFERPEDMVTPALAAALISLSIGIYKKGSAA